MAWLRWFLVGLALGAGVLYLARRPPADAGTVLADFTRRVSEASERRPGPDVFTTGEATVGGRKKRVIAVHEPSRIAWDLDLPRHARLEVSLALQEAAWSASGDGVLFRVGITVEGRYEELVARVVHPQAVESDRRWIPVEVDLSPYAGRHVSLIFNTASGLEGDDRENDLALWGDPRIVIR